MRVLLVILLFIIPCISFAQIPGTDYKIYDAHLRKEVTVDELIQNIQAGEVLIFGEQHDDATGHLMELKILEALYQKLGKEIILSMEMFHRDVQYILNEYLADQISEKNFIKEAKAWDTYKTDYRPAIEFAKEKELKVIAANAPSRYANLVTRKGLSALNSLSKIVRENYIAPLPIDTMTGIYYEKFQEAMGGHSMPGMNLYQSQNLWDATMSWSVMLALKDNKRGTVFMMNGRFHSDDHLGLAKRLTDDYKKKVTTISCFAAEDFLKPEWGKYIKQADYILLTQPKNTGTETK